MDIDYRNFFQSFKVTSLKLSNFKNVKMGEINFETKDEPLNIIGIYGQNGSGKTAIVEAFILLKSLFSGISLDDKVKDSIMFGCESMSLEVSFKMLTLNNNYIDVNYFVEIGKNTDDINKKVTSFIQNNENTKNIIVLKEVLKYKVNDERFKTFINFDINKKDFMTKANYKSFLKVFESETDIFFIKKYAKLEATSFIFNNQMIKIFSHTLNNIRAEDIGVKNYNSIDITIKICYFSILGLQIFDENMTSNIAHMPVFKNGFLSKYISSSNNKITTQDFDKISNTLHHINIVLKTIVPDLELIIEKIDTVSDEEVTVQYFTKRNDIKINLKYESQGIKKIVSLLNALIEVYNNSSYCLIIDELDANIYEYLLGELLEVLKENAKGQLIFTSHNLRPLEVLNEKSIVFTTINEENRFIKFKNIKKTNNLRDKYYETIQLGGQDEYVYEETKGYKIRRAFKKAGDLNGKK